MSATKTTWTERDYSALSWHDNHVHAFRLVEGKHGSGTLIFDIDHIVEWTKNADGQIAFRIAPASLEFHEATNLRFSLDYASVTAAMVPFSIDSIIRKQEQRERYTATVWQIVISWPKGDLTFEAPGFTQTLRCEPILSDQQWLSEDERRGI